MTYEPLLLFGASIRAVAQSCARSGFACRGADLFADVDTQQVAAVSQIVDYPKGLHEVAETFAPGVWMYTGGLENYPGLVDAIASRHRLLGISGTVLRRIRDPVQLHLALAEAGLPTPATTLDGSQLASDVRWLRKPIRSCGGGNIAELKLRQSAQNLLSGDVYFQQSIDGSPAAAIFLASKAEVKLAGVSRQIVGQAWTAAGPYQYSGSIGPVPLNARLATQIETIGRVLASEFRLCGLFGVDGILQGDDFWTVEVNPRYTASVEVLERAGAGQLFEQHVATFGVQPRMVRTPSVGKQSRNQLHGKAIVFADTTVRIGPDFTALVQHWNAAAKLPLIADIPSPGSVIRKIRPIATVFAAADTEAGVCYQLRERTEAVRASVEAGLAYDTNE